MNIKEPVIARISLTGKVNHRNTVIPYVDARNKRDNTRPDIKIRIRPQSAPPRNQPDGTVD